MAGKEGGCGGGGGSERGGKKRGDNLAQVMVWWVWWRYGEGGLEVSAVEEEAFAAVEEFEDICTVISKALRVCTE